MAARVPRGVVLISILMLALGGYLIYSGAFQIYEGTFLESVEGAYEEVLAPLDMFWRILGIAYVLLGLLCFPLGGGLLAMKTWARKNSFMLLCLILIMGFTVGLISANYGLMASLPFFSIMILAAIMALHLRKPAVKNAFEYHGQGKGIDFLETPNYREIKRRNVVVRKPVQVRVTSESVKCARCGSMNRGNRTTCKMCGRELEG